MLDKIEIKEDLEGKETVVKEIPVPPEQQWQKYMLDQQTKLLEGINGKLTFIVVIIIIGIVVSLLRGCA
ncbi:MAG: hypothetical protein ABSA23_16100 [Anaerolineales bacterium]|jgi:hypothetical protein